MKVALNFFTRYCFLSKIRSKCISRHISSQILLQKFSFTYQVNVYILHTDITYLPPFVGEIMMEFVLNVSIIIGFIQVIIYSIFVCNNIMRDVSYIVRS